MRSNQYPTNKFEVLHITNPLTPRSDKHVTSPYNIYTLYIQQTGSEITQTNIRYKILSWLNTKFL